MVHAMHGCPHGCAPNPGYGALAAISGGSFKSLCSKHMALLSFIIQERQLMDLHALLRVPQRDPDHPGAAWGLWKRAMASFFPSH